MLPLLILACGSGLPTPWSTTEGREEVTLPPAPATPAPAVAAAGGVAAPEGAPVTCEVELEGLVGEALGTLSCGQRVTGASGRGARRLGDDFYQRAFCTPHRNGYDEAPEALYRLEVPADTKATVTLESPCADLDLVAVAWQLPGVPGVEHVGRIRECEMDTDKGGGGKLTLTSVTRAETYLVGVDGKDGVEGNYAISVDCEGYR